MATPSYCRTLNQAGNVEKWTEGDARLQGDLEARGGRLGTGPITEMERMKSFSGYLLPTYSGAPETGFRLATVAGPPPGGLRRRRQIRFYPGPGFASRMVWAAMFERRRLGHLHHHQGPARRMVGGQCRLWDSDGHLGIARLTVVTETWRRLNFIAAGAKVIAADGRDPGLLEPGEDKDTFKAAFDGNTSTFFDALQSNGAFVQVDTGFGTDYALSEGFDQLMLVRYLNFPSTTESHRAGERVYVFFLHPTPNPILLRRLEGFIDILDDPSATSTMATMPGTGTKMWLAAAYKPVPPGSSILTVYRGVEAGSIRRA